MIITNMFYLGRSLRSLTVLMLRWELIKISINDVSNLILYYAVWNWIYSKLYSDIYMVYWSGTLTYDCPERLISEIIIAKCDCLDYYKYAYDA